MTRYRSYGFVRLIHNDKIIRSAPYSGKSMRNKILEKWRKWYGDKFIDCEIVIELPEMSRGAKRGDFWERRLDDVDNAA